MKIEKLLSSVRLLPVYAVFIYTWLITGFSKLTGDGVRPSFRDDFGETFLASFPGLTVAFYQIAIFEVIAALLFVLSLLRFEFLVGRPKIFLEFGLWMSMVNFAMLGFGLRLIGKNDGAASLFFYFGATAAVWVFTVYGTRDREPIK